MQLFRSERNLRPRQRGKMSKTEPGGIAKTHTLNTLGSSTPATDGERVYCYFWDGKQVGVSAYDFAGKSAWQHDN